MKAGTKLTLVVGVGAGYVLGARAGRERYDKIVAVARKVADAPAVRQTANVLQVQAFEITKNTAAKGREAVGHVVETVRHRGDHGEDGDEAHVVGADRSNGVVGASGSPGAKPGH